MLDDPKIPQTPHDGALDEPSEVDRLDIDHSPSLDADPGHKTAAGDIHRLLAEYIDRTVKIGEVLLKVKADLKLRGEKGAFLAWLDANFGWTARTAQRFMRVSEFCRKYPEAEALSPSVVILLAAGTTPAEVLAAVLVEKRLGAHPTRSQVERLIGEARSPNLFQLAATEDVPTRGAAAATRRIGVAQDAADLILSRLHGLGDALRDLIDRTDADALMAALRAGLAAQDDVRGGSHPA